MRRFLVRDVNLLCIVAMVLVMAVLGGFGWQRSAAVQSLREATSRLGSEAGLLDAIGQGLRDTERTQLAYVSSGARTDLLSYRAAVRRTDALVDRLERQADTDAVSGEMLLGLTSLVDLRQDALAQEVALRTSRTPANPSLEMQQRDDSPKRGDVPHGATVLDQLVASAQALEHARQLSLDAETRGLQSVRWLGAAVAFLGLVSALSLFHLLSSAWRRLARAETEQRTMALQLRGSLDSLSQGIAVFSTGGHLLNWNMRLRQMLDLPAALLQRGLSYAVLEQHLASGGAAFLEPLHAIQADAPGCHEVRPVVYERAVRQRAANGETQIEIRRTPMPQGGFVLTLTDMTERVQAERMLNEAQKMQALGQLTGGIAHDFNNMLTVILGSLEISAAETATSASELVPLLAARMRRATQAAENGAALTRQLLAFARKQPLAPAPVDVGTVLPDLVPLLHHTVGENIVLSFHAEPGLWQAVADAGQLESAVLNLALNARDAMPGGGRLAIEACNVSIDPRWAQPHPDLVQGEYVRISVADTGQGMSREVVARAFEPFFTTKPEGRGTGLGLAMVFGFARQSGGLALIQSEPGQGSRITLYLPRAPTIGALDGAAASLHPAGLHPAGLHPASLHLGRSRSGTRGLPAVESRGARHGFRRKRHILLVDDDASVREIASEVLRELGYMVSEAPDAEAALHGLGGLAGPLDLLLTDLMLPGVLDGRALAARVRQIRPAARILYMSGHLDAAQSLDTGADGASHWLGKPFRPAQLASKVDGLIGADPAGQPA